MNIDEIFESKYLSHSELGGTEHTATIASVISEQIGSGADAKRKPVVHLHGFGKAWVLNKVNASVIADRYGKDTAGWIGKAVTLYPDRTSFQGRMVDCIRCRVPMQQSVPVQQPVQYAPQPAPQYPAAPQQAAYVPPAQPTAPAAPYFPQQAPAQPAPAAPPYDPNNPFPGDSIPY